MGAACLRCTGGHFRACGAAARRDAVLKPEPPGAAGDTFVMAPSERVRRYAAWMPAIRAVAGRIAVRAGARFLGHRAVRTEQGH